MGWEITIDAAGRVVIPKEVRQKHHLSGGSRLTLVTDEERLVLIPSRQQTSTIEKAGLLVFRGELDVETPDHRAIREESLARFGGT